MALLPYSRSRKSPAGPAGPRGRRALSPGAAKNQARACILAALGAAALAPAGAAQDRDGAGEADATVVAADYSAYFFGIKVMETEYLARFGADAYSIEAVYHTGGPFSWVRDDRIEAEVRGEVADGRLRPRTYRHQNVTSEKRRRVALTFSDDDVAAEIEPPFGSMGEPPASRDQRAGSLDLLSGIMQIALRFDGRADYPCGGDIPIFDGKQRYDLRMAYAGRGQADLDGYDGPVVRCDVYYMPVAGYDPEDIPKEERLNTPLEVWLTDTPDSGHVPVRFSYDVGISSLVIEIKALEVSGPARRQHAAR